MITLSQILIILGLYFEFLALLVTVWKLFYGYKEWIRQLGPTTDEELRRRKKEGSLILIFFSIGMVLQIIALFL